MRLYLEATTFRHAGHVSSQYVQHIYPVSVINIDVYDLAEGAETHWGGGGGGRRGAGLVLRAGEHHPSPSSPLTAALDILDAY